VYDVEAAEEWAAHLGERRAWNVTITKLDGTEVECQIADYDNNEPDGFYTLTAHEGHGVGERPEEPTLRFRCDEITAVAIH
jgi:hypothetical protein